MVDAGCPGLSVSADTLTGMSISASALAKIKANRNHSNGQFGSTSHDQASPVPVGRLTALQARTQVEQRIKNKQPLTNLSLPGAYLAYMDLHGQDFTGCDLSGADLHFADMSGTTCRAVDFGEANLSQVDLQGADLQGSTLVYAKVTPSYLWQGAELHDTDLGNTGIYDATMLPDSVKTDSTTIFDRADNQ